MPHVHKAFKYRLYPSEEQQRYFKRLFGCCRFVYNHFLHVKKISIADRREWIAAHEGDASRKGEAPRIPNAFDMSRMLTDLKRSTFDREGHAYLYDVDSTALLYEIRHVEAALERFFQRVKANSSDGSKRSSNAERASFPRMKRKRQKRSATVAFKKPEHVERRRVRLAKIGWVRADVHRPIEGKPVSATVSLDASGRWWVSVACKDVEVEALPPSGSVATVTPEILGGALCRIPGGDPLERRLATEKRNLSRKRGPWKKHAASNNYRKQMKRVSRASARISDRRVTLTHQLSSRLVRESGTIVVHPLPDGVHDPAYTELVRQLRYKCEWHGRTLLELPAELADKR